MSSLKKRKIYIDYLRVFSCISVILIHIFTTARTDFINHSIFEDVVSELIINFFHFSVPIFFMITGYLFLSKDRDYSLKEFFKKYVLKYIIAIFTFGLVYALIEEIFNKNYSLFMPINALLNTLRGKTWAHMWYLYSLVGVMLLIPILKTLLDKDKKYLKYILMILLISSFLMPLLENFFNFSLGFDLIIMSPYLAYVIIGYYLGTKDSIDKKYLWFTLIIFSLIIILSIIFSTLYTDTFLGKLSYLGKYNSFAILGLSICIFLLFKSIKRDNKLISFISQDTYGMYLIHMFWINLIYKFFKINIYGNMFIIKSIFLFIVVFFLTLFSAKLMRKIPLINRII